MEKYLKMSDVFKSDILVSNSTVYTLKSELDKLHRVREVNDDTLMCSGGDVAEYAAHAINSHDELVAMNKELLAALEGVLEYASKENVDVANKAISKSKGAAS